MILLITSSLLFGNRLAAPADEPLKITIEAPKEVTRGEPICLRYRFDNVADIQQTPLIGKDGVSWISCVATDSEGKKHSSQSEPKLYVPPENLEGAREKQVEPGKSMIGEAPVRLDTSSLAPGMTHLAINVRLPVVNSRLIESGNFRVLQEAKIQVEVNVVQNDPQLAQDASALMLDVEKSRRIDNIRGNLIDNGMDEKSLRKLLLFEPQALRPLFAGASECGFTSKACGMVAQSLISGSSVEGLRALEHFFAGGVPLEACQWIRPLEESGDEQVAHLAIRIMKRSEPTTTAP